MPRTRVLRFPILVLLSLATLSVFGQTQLCESIVRADVVAFDWAYQINRLGTTRTNGELYALREDVVSSDPSTSELRPGKVALRRDKRPRPIVLRVNAGSCLEIKFTNLLTPKPADPMQPVTRTASIHVSGMQVFSSIADDGTWVGQNPLIGKGQLSGIVAPSVSMTYRLYAQEEGTNLLYSTAAQYNNFNPMQISTGLFGSVNVEPRSSEWYRSQVSEDDLKRATVGTLPSGHPQIDYDAVYPSDHPRAGKPILRMIDGGGNLVHSDLTAIITGPDHGLLPGGPGDNPMLPDRNLPFREVSILYHEAQDVVQAFPYFMYANNSQTPRNDAGADTFGINFGIAGIAPVILANRIGVGPALDCPECKFEEFFLSSWAIGDPSIVVDVPANAPCKTAELLELTLKLEENPRTFNPDPAIECKPEKGKKATKALFPDDPSNVYHSYLGDHVRFRVLHGGAAVHHIHHHHAHQWLRTPESSQSNYLDAQAVGPGSSFTAELVFAGSGNRNLTTGDSIFHCHFYPHFASGMWALYRVHDVFEAGTELDAQGRPVQGARALPDGEIDRGTPIPAVVPMPMMAMAPMPSKIEIVDGQARVSEDGHPGFPFFIPGVAGHRAPHPPMDFAVEPKTKEVLDGGLPRHLIDSATIVNEQHTSLDWSKDLGEIVAYELPEEGTAGEKRAIKFFSTATHASVMPDGKPALFRVNGLPRGPMPGAPFSDPAVVDGQAVGNPLKIYRGVDLQLNAVFNKAGWHYPQQRILALWGDVKEYVDGNKPPEPLFFRATNNDVIEYWHTNLVPAYFELDDFEVRTPTDILGQHIHLVKFDVMTSDGAANGFNYEDGTFSPEEVQERIHSINLTGGLWDESRKTQRKLTAKAIAELGEGPTKGSKAWVGAQATVQRWWLDPLMDIQPNKTKVTEKDRTYMTVFTHDHFGPSTHQMIGLYGGLLIEPPNTKWTSLDGKTVFGTRYDGGPTSYAANIIFNDPQLRNESYREFALEWGDTQHGYTQFSRHRPDCYRYTRPDGTVYEQKPPDFDCIPLAAGQQYYGWADPANVLNCINCPPQPPLAPEPQSLIPNLPGSAPWPPQPLLVTDFSVGMMSMNYRLEPLPARVFTPGVTNPKAASDAADLSSAFRSIERLDPAYSRQPAGGSQINPMCSGAGCFTFPKTEISAGMAPTDPYTPMLHGYEGDKVQVRLLAGAHTSMHDYTMHGMRWLAEPFEKNSGYRNTQFILLSEHYELLFDLPRIGADNSIDYLYNPSASYEGLTNGAWGLFRVWNPMKKQPFLAPLRSGTMTPPIQSYKPPTTMTTDCSQNKPCIREYEVHAMTVQQATNDPNASILYNKRGVNLTKGASDTANPLEDPLGLVYVVVPKGQKHKPTKTVEPMVLRANAGDWVHVTLVNDFTGDEKVFKTFEAASRFGLTYASPYNYIQIASSPNVGLHAQLVSYDVRSSDGASIGNNPVQTAAPGRSVDYWWYAGVIEGGKQTPVEFGSINLLPSDPLMQVYRGLFGSLIVEPIGSRWMEDPHSSSSATVWAGDKVFREFVVTYQNDANMLTNGASWWSTGNPLAGFNYRSEPPWLRFGKMLDSALGASKPADWTNLTQGDVNNISALPMTLVNGTATTANQLVRADPETPIFRAPARMPARFRLVMPGGDGDNQITWELTGHLWQEEPYTNNSTKIGYNPKSQTNGSLTGFGVTSAYEVILDSTPGSTPSGGRFGVPGDYMYRAWTANMFQGGAWGIFRVAPWKGTGFPDTVGITSAAETITGYTTPCPVTIKGVCNAGGYVSSVSVAGKNTPVVNGLWSFTPTGPLGDTFTVTSPAGGVATWGIVTNADLTAAEQPLIPLEDAGPRPQRNSRP